MLDQVEEGRLSPMQIVEYEYEWLFARGHLEQMPHRPEALLGRARGLSGTNRTGDGGRDRLRFVVSSEQRLDPGADARSAHKLGNDLSERCERHALAIRGARAPEDPRYGIRPPELHLQWPARSREVQRVGAIRLSAARH